MNAAIAVSLSGWRMPLPDALDQARAVGARLVDLIAIPGWRQLDPVRLAEDPEGWAARIGRELRRRGLAVAALNAAVPDPHRSVAPARRRAALRQAEALAIVAARLGARVVTLYPGYHHDGPIDRAELIRSCRAWVAIGRRHGVHLAPEIHWRTVAADAAAAHELVAAVPGLRLTCDPSHALVEGRPLAEWQPLAAHIAHIHLRDAVPGRLSVPWGTGALDLPSFLRMLGGYRGAIAIEPLPDDPAIPDAIRRIGADLAAGLRTA